MSFPCSRARGLDRTELPSDRVHGTERGQVPAPTAARQAVRTSATPQGLCGDSDWPSTPVDIYKCPAREPSRTAGPGSVSCPTQVVKPLHVADTPWCFNNPKRRVRPDPPLQGIQSRVRGQDGRPQHAASCRQLGLQVKTKASRCFLSALTTAGSSPFRMGASPRHGPRARCRRAWGGSTRPHQEPQCRR